MAPEQLFRGMRHLYAAPATLRVTAPRIDNRGSIATMPPRVETLPATTSRATAPTEIGRKRHADHQGAGPVSGAVRAGYAAAQYAGGHRAVGEELRLQGHPDPDRGCAFLQSRSRLRQRDVLRRGQG